MVGVKRWGAHGPWDGSSASSSTHAIGNEGPRVACDSGSKGVVVVGRGLALKPSRVRLQPEDLLQAGLGRLPRARAPV